MKKRILLIILMFMFITNVKALTFNVGVTNIEEVGTDSLGSVTKIDIPDREVDVLFEEIGAEASFSLTVTNTGDRAGTLREINITSENDKIEYTTNLPEGGLAINGNDTNVVTITAKLKEGAVNGKSSSEIKVKYAYDEGSCPEGEILSEDESMCLCPEGYERNEKGICVKPEKEEKIECKDDEIYNESKKICEKKVIPVPDKVVPNNPKTLDNIVLITLLFIVSGLGIYAVMYKKLKTTKKKVTAGVITGVATFAVSFTVLAGVFGLDNLLGAIVNPITKNKELKITVYEEIDLIETWDGDCDLEVGQLSPGNIFDGGSGTEADPYRVKTANQLACFAKSVNNGTTYEGKFIKQTKTIKLNDNLNAQAKAGDLSNAHLWISAGEKNGWDNSAIINHFDGTYDGDNHVISGLYLTDDSTSSTDQYYDYKGMFGVTKNATFKNMILSDVYFNTTGNTGPLIGYALENLTLDNITTYGNGIFTSNNQYGVAGVVSNYDGESVGNLKIENTINNVNMTCGGQCSGVIARIEDVNTDTTNPNLIFKNVTNNGNIRFTYFPLGASGIAGYLYASTGNLLADNCVNTGDFTFDEGISGDAVTGLFGYVRLYDGKFVVTNSHNEGDITGFNYLQAVAGIGGDTDTKYTYIDNCYNSGNFIANVTSRDVHSYAGGILGSACEDEEILFVIKNSFNTGDIYSPNGQYIAGMVGKYEDYDYSEKRLIENCYNTGDFTGVYGNGGIAGQYGGTIKNCYNTGDIYSETNTAAGILGYGGYSHIFNSYNTGKITINNGGSYIGGIVASGSTIIANCYNRGDLVVETYCSDVGGIQGQNGFVFNSYNSGNIEVLSGAPIYAAGIGYGGTRINTYNLGNLTNTNGGSYFGGIGTSDARVLNSVNKGNLTINVTKPLENPLYINMAGVSYYAAASGWGESRNNFNAGTLSINSNYDITQDDFNGSKHTIRLGEIAVQNYSGSLSENLGNKFNTDPSKKALGCNGIDSSCTDEQSNFAGQYTDEETPDILSIINANSTETVCNTIKKDDAGNTCVFDNSTNTCTYETEPTFNYTPAYKCTDFNIEPSAFEIKDGDTLPTLKSFNQ